MPETDNFKWLLRFQNNEPPSDALPGFEFVGPPARPCEQDMSDESRYTGEVLFRDHPDVFKAVAAAFFVDGLSIRATAARYRVSVNTVRAIRDMAIADARTDAARAAFFIKSKAEKLHGIIRTRSLEAIYDRLSNPKKVDDIPIDTLMKLADLTSGEQSERRPSMPAASEIIDVEEFEDVMNGLEAGKKSARDDGREIPLECSTENENRASRSVGLNDERAICKGFDETLCNSLSNPCAIPTPADEPANPHPPTGGGGVAGGARAGG